MKNFFKMTVAMLLAVAIVALPACNPDNGVDNTPALSVIGADEPISVPVEGGEYELDITSANLEWAIEIQWLEPETETEPDYGEGDNGGIAPLAVSSSNEGWITLSQATGTESAKVTVTVDGNVGASRQALLVLTTNAASIAPVEVKVSQRSHNEPYLEIQDLTGMQLWSLEAEKEGLTKKIQILAENTNWTLEVSYANPDGGYDQGGVMPLQAAEENWVHVDVTEGTVGLTEVTVTIDPNSDLNRSATLNVYPTNPNFWQQGLPIAQRSGLAIPASKTIAEVMGELMESATGQVALDLHGVQVYHKDDDGMVIGDATGHLYIPMVTPPVALGDVIGVTGTLAISYETLSLVVTDAAVAGFYESGLYAELPEPVDYTEYWENSVMMNSLVLPAYVKAVVNYGTKEVGTGIDEVNWTLTGVTSVSTLINPNWTGSIFSLMPTELSAGEWLAGTEVGQALEVTGWITGVSQVFTMSPNYWGDMEPSQELMASMTLTGTMWTDPIVVVPVLTLDKMELSLPAAGLAEPNDEYSVYVSPEKLGDNELKATATAPFVATVAQTTDWMGNVAYSVYVTAPKNELEEALTGTLTIYVGDEANPLTSETVALNQKPTITGKTASVVFKDFFTQALPSGEVYAFEANSPIMLAPTENGDAFAINFTTVTEKNGYKTGWHNGQKVLRDENNQIVKDENGNNVMVDVAPTNGISLLNGDVFTITTMSGNVTIKQVRIDGSYYYDTNIEAVTEGGTASVEDGCWVWTGKTTKLDLKHLTNKYGSVKSITIIYTE